MRMATYQKVRTWLLSCLVFLTAAICMVLGVREVKPLLANAQEPTVNRTLQSGEYQTNGASMRVFKKTSTGDLVETENQGIRFHVEMGSGYKHGAQVLFDETTKNERDAWMLADGYKTYTLILPKRLLNGNLTVDTDKVMQLETSEYWYTDGDGNLESVAYIYDIPEKWRTDIFCFKGIICTVAQDGTETVVAETETSERCLAYVAKMSYKDTIDPDTVTWGTESSPLDDVAAPLLKAFVPTYTINYTVGGSTYTEEVLWDEKPVGAPSFEIPEGGYIDYTQAWFDTENNVEFDVSKIMSGSTNATINLVNSSATKFSLTGVADYNYFTVNGGTELYNGVKLYATIPVADLFTTEEIASGTDKMVELAKDAVKVEYKGNGSFDGLQGVWAMLEGKGSGAQLRVVLAFNSDRMVNGDEITLLENSVLYANNIMYQLSQEYTIDFSIIDGVEDYGVFLGYLHNADILEVKNWVEPSDNTRKRIRVEFRKDVFINSDFKIVYDGELPAGYEYPFYVYCEEGGGSTPITQGYYHWNNGEHAILELEAFGHHTDEIIYGVPGLKIVQNGGYFIFADTIKWEHNGDEWVEGREKGTFSASSFETKGENASDTTEARFTTNGNTALTAGGTTNRWFDDVVVLRVENMSTTEPYAVFATNADGTVVPLEDFRYHGQTTQNGYNHILGFSGYEGTVAGDMITILGGTRFWYHSEYFTASETINFYYNGMCWVANSDGTANQAIAASDFTGDNYNYFEGGTNRIRMKFAVDAFSGNTGTLTIESGSIKVNGKAYTQLQYYGSTHRLFEIHGDALAPIGQEAFVDTLVIEAGTKVWMGAEKGSEKPLYCLEFTETLSWKFIGDGALTDGGRNPLDIDWVTMSHDTEITRADIRSMGNATDAGGEVRLYLQPGILTNAFYGFAVIETSKGLPVVNGVEFADTAFAYGMQNNLLAVRGGQYGQKKGDYIMIPAGSVWWTSQGTLTFVEEIVGVFNGGVWLNASFNPDNHLGEITKDNLQQVMNSGTEEIRLQIDRGISDTYYGAMMLYGDAYVTRANGTREDIGYGYWYGGNSGTYMHSGHSLVGLQAAGIASSSNGDKLTIKAGTKFILQNNTGYHTFAEDIVYVYNNGTWVSATGYSVTFNLGNATAMIGGQSIADGESVTMYVGAQTISLAAPDGYSIVSVTNGQSNCDGTYTVNITGKMTITVETKQSVKLSATPIDTINVYSEGAYTGVRINLSEAATPGLNNITGANNYGMTVCGMMSLTIAGAPASFDADRAYNYFGAEHGSLLELRFATANLRAGDTFTIKAGTVFNHANMAYAIEVTEDIVGLWTGSKWLSQKLGEIDWSRLQHIASYSDLDGSGNPLNYTVRLIFKEDLFDFGSTVTKQLSFAGTITFNGTAYTGGGHYHAAGNKVLQISEWQYHKDDVLVIPAGTMIYVDGQYYEVTKTLTATCTADGTGAAWSWTIS